MTIRATFVALVLAAVAGCATSPTAPSEAAIVTFRVGNETFRVQLDSRELIAAAHAARHGGLARIPNGRVVAGTGVNTGWSWHLEEVTFAEVTMELCDGRPSDVEREGPSYGGGRYCPWGAIVIKVE